MTGRPPVRDDSPGPASTGTPPVLVLAALGGLYVTPNDAQADQRGGTDTSLARWRTEVHELGRRRRKLALLVYLRLTPRPVSRDLLLDLLWPEDEPERGRHSLNEALSHLRRVLGRDALGPRGGDVRLAPDAPLSSDVVEFDQAVLRDHPEEIVARYTGPFLDGVFVDRAPRFEMWVANEREQRRRQVVAACQTLCATPLTAESAPVHVGAARRWLDASPGSADAARAWIDALTFTGSDDAVRAGLAAFEQVAREVQHEDDEPLPLALQQLGERLRERVAQAEAATEVTLARASRSSLPLVADTPLPTLPSPSSPSSPSSPAPVTRAPSRRHWLPVVSVLSTVVAGAALLATSTRPSRDQGTDRATAPRPWIVVAPVAVSGKPDTTDLSGAIGVALASALSRYPTVDVVPSSRIAATLARMQRPDSAARDERSLTEAAERIGASVVAFPEAAMLGNTTVLRVRLLNPQGAPAAAPLEVRIASADDWISAIDGLGADLVRRVNRSSASSRAAAPLPPATTPSLPALRAFAAAGRAQQRRSWDDAVEALRQAVSIDPDFSQAWADLGELYSLLNRPRDADSAFVRAMTSATRLAPRERLLVQTSVLREQRRFDEALRGLDAWLIANPGDRALIAEQAALLFQRGDNAAARRAYRALLAVDSLDPMAWASYAAAFASAEAAAAHDSAARAYERAARLDSVVRTDAVWNHQWGASLVRAGRPDSAARIFSLMLDRSPALRARGLRSLAHLAIWRQRPAEALAPLREALRLEEQAKAGATTLVRTRLLLAVVLDRTGDGRGARAQRDSAMQRAISLELQEPLLYFLLGKERVRHGERADARAVLSRLRAVAIPVNARHTASRLLLEAELDAADGRVSLARVRADSGVALDATTLTLDTQARVLRRLAAVTGDSTVRRQALEADRKLAARRDFGWEGTLVWMEAQARIEAGAFRDTTAARR